MLMMMRTGGEKEGQMVRGNNTSWTHGPHRPRIPGVTRVGVIFGDGDHVSLIPPFDRTTDKEGVYT